MPYIITTARTNGELHDDSILSSTRTAVATLDEARLIASGIWQKHLGYRKYGPTEDDLKRYGNWAVPESGGSIGPLPDGTVIEVTPVEWHDLINQLIEAGDGDALIERDGIIAAFNAA